LRTLYAGRPADAIEYLTSDPTPAQQASTMYLMNLFMLFLFYGLPSGLVFYWTVMNLYTSLQQWLAIRGDDGVVVPAGTGSARAKS